MLNTMIVAAVTNFSGTTTPDKNGESPIMLQCIAGIMPNRNVLSGTVARRAGIEVGKTYLINVRETGFDDLFGPDFTFVKVMELTSGVDIVKAAKELGDPKIQIVIRPEGFDQHYKRKGDAVEGQRTKRMREGSYHPLVPTTVLDHKTAESVREGTSVNSGGQILPGEGEWSEEEFPDPLDEELRLRQEAEGKGNEEHEDLSDEERKEKDLDEIKNAGRKTGGTQKKGGEKK